MSARYIIRLDDACDTLNKKNWNSIEKIMDKFKVKPIVSVIPENLDSSLHYDTKDKNFWKKVRKWEKKGWCVALHGFNHLFHKVHKKKLFFPYYNTSEFAGLKKNIQCNLIKKSYKKFLKQGIRPKVWVAPRHTFDANTLKALEEETPIRIISDGIAFQPYNFKNFIFVPQQLWWPIKKKFGIWTICLHPNTMSNTKIDELKKIFSKKEFIKKIVDIDYVLNRKINFQTIFDKTYQKFFFFKKNIKEILNYVKYKIKNFKISI
jgi:predicted deacetylase